MIQALDVENIWPVFERKAAHKQIDPARFAECFEKRMPQWKARWEVEMSEHLTGEPPAFDGLERAVRRELRTQLRSS